MRHTRVAAFIHFVWATWDRLPLLTGEFEREAHRAIAAKCVKLHADVVAIGGIEDHVHLLVRIPATISLADLVGQAKGATAHLATHRLLPPGQFFKWQGAYAAFSVSLSDVPRVKAYIARQREHHALGTTLDEWELGARRESATVTSSHAAQAILCSEAAQAAFVANGLQARLQAPALGGRWSWF